MSHLLPRLAQRIFNTPLAIHPAKAEIIVAALADRLGVTRFQNLEADAPRPMAMEDAEYGFAEPGRTVRTGYENYGGIACIDVCGTLVQKLGSLRPFSGMTGYDGIRQNFLTALADPDVQAIALSIDSPGGEVAGCFDLVDTIYASRGQKPVWAILNESAYSAAYAIASAADKIYVPRTGGVGSIGVVWMHVDWSKAITNAGLDVTFMIFGSRKIDGASEMPLSPEARERFQVDIDAMGELFVETVARNRGISASVIRDTQAACFMGQEGVALKLADAVMAPDAAFGALLQEVGRITT
jgi:signal peptide peptidase SppA